MAKKDEAKGEGEAVVVETPDSPLLDLSDAAVKRMLKIAKKRGWVTQDELNAVLPSEEISSDQIEDMNAMLSEMGINVVESEDAEEADKESAEAADEEEAEGGELVEAARPTAVATRSSEPAERTDDPVRMYLREMGSVELLSREGEIAIAKRIEAGREAMIAGLCESPLTFQAIIIWRDELNDAKILLRDIIDLEATYAGPDGKKAPKTDYSAPGAPPPPNPARDRMAPATAPQAPPEGFEGEALRRPTASTTRTISRIPCRCRRWRPISSRRCSRPSTASPTPTRSCAACRIRTSRTSSRASRSRPLRSANTRR